MDTDLSHEALARFEHDEEHINDLEDRVAALEGGGATSLGTDEEPEDEE